MLGFTYNGIHCSAFGLYYIPDESDRWFGDPEYDVYSNDIAWRNGGYYYDSKAKIRTFTLKCGFEEIDVTTRQKIKQWVKMGTRGWLVFDDKPFVFWDVRPGKIPVGKWYLDTNESHSGTVNITFTAYEPFGYLTRKSNAQSDDDNANEYCNLIPADEMPSAPSTSSTTFDVYNPGTEECGLSIELSGSASNPVRFYNNANGTQCVIGSFPTSNIHLKINGDTGYVSVGAYDENGYAYHDKGFVKLSPNIAYYNEDYVYQGMNGTKYLIDVPNIPVTEDIKNAVIYLNGVSNTSFRVDDVDIINRRLTCTRTGSGTPGDTGECTLYTYNKIDIQEKVNSGWTLPSTLSLNSISVNYNPRIL